MTGNVVPITPGTDVQTSALVMPKHFRGPKAGKMRAAWEDLVSTTDAALHVKQNGFMFEIAATLLAKFRAGTTMSATESKELKKQMIALGLAKDDSDPGSSRLRKNADYFDR